MNYDSSDQSRKQFVDLDSESFDMIVDTVQISAGGWLQRIYLARMDQVSAAYK